MTENITIIHNIVSMGKYGLMFHDVMYIRISGNICI
jgi:hypothetical protein